MSSLIISPVGNGAVIQFDGFDGGGTDHWNSVVNNDNKFIFVTGDGGTNEHIDLFTSSIASRNATVSQIRVHYIIFAHGNSAWARAVLRVGSTNYQPNGWTPFASVDWSPSDHDEGFTTNPATGVAWTWAEAQALQVGLNMRRDSGAGAYAGKFYYIYWEIIYNDLPNTPSTPTGDAHPVHGVSHDYSSSAVDPGGDQVGLVFIWGDGTANTDVGLGASGATRTASHSWATPGTYSVNVVAYDSAGQWSSWSTTLSVVVNHTPNIPSVPSGVSRGAPGISYSFSSTATDPDGDNIYYLFDWGDGQSNYTGWLASGQQGSLSHSWSAPGTYLVKVAACDALGEVSGWSETLSVLIVSPSGRGMVIGLW